MGQSRTASTVASHLQQVADGIYRLDLPVPFKGLRQINLWFLRDDAGWLMIDCGWGDDASREVIAQAWDELPGGGPVERLLITHFHPDHMGNSGWISEHWGLVPQMSALEWDASRRSDALKGPDNVPAQAEYFRHNGLSGEQIEVYRDEFLTYDKGVALPADVALVRDGDTLTIGGTQWTILTGGGHSPEMVMLHAPERRLFISGDQLLPRISSNISIGYWNPDADPLSDYLTSLQRLSDLLSPETLVLCSHGDPFHDGAARASVLMAHHAERLGLMRDALSDKGRMTVADFMPVLFSPRLDGTQVGFAMGEVAAHLNHLVQRGEAAAVALPGGGAAFEPADAGSRT